MKPKDFDSLLIFTDGACSGNPGPGGWGAIVVEPNGSVKELGGADKETTNNRMEMMAAIKSLAYVKDLSSPIQFYTDSTYVIRGITQWVWGWRRNQWRNAEGNEVSNRDLWEKLFSLVMDRSANGKIEWLYSRGHVGIPGNERCDEIAVGFSKGQWVDLYEGSLLQYPVAIFDLPEDTKVPEMKPKAAKKKAHSYLSYLHGQVYRHMSWSECERRVKGQSGAKFKKALSPADEKKILKDWGLGDEEIKE